MTESHAHISVAVRDGVAELTLRRPAVLNALTVSMAAELLDAVRTVAADDTVRAVLLTGAGRAFCSGADLAGDAGGGTVDVGDSLERYFNPLLEILFAMPKPLVVAVNGPAAGAGFSLALAGDLILAARSAYFVQAFVKVGLVPDLGATWLLPRQIGRGRAMALMMLGERLPAETALAWGMVHGVEEDAALPEAARTLAARLAAGPTRAYALLRRAVREGLEGGLTEALARERLDQREAGRTRDFAEGARAFLDRRAPVFTGG